MSGAHQFYVLSTSLLAGIPRGMLLAIGHMDGSLTNLSDTLCCRNGWPYTIHKRVFSVGGYCAVRPPDQHPSQEAILVEVSHVSRI